LCNTHTDTDFDAKTNTNARHRQRLHDGWLERHLPAGHVSDRRRHVLR
jgi:hypothetical protein